MLAHLFEPSSLKIQTDERRAERSKRRLHVASAKFAVGRPHLRAATGPLSRQRKTLANLRNLLSSIDHRGAFRRTPRDEPSMTLRHTKHIQEPPRALSGHTGIPCRPPSQASLGACREQAHPRWIDASCGKPEQLPNAGRIVRLG